MKTRPWKIVLGAGSLGAALLLGACGDSAQKQAYEHAVRLEQETPSGPEHAHALIAGYQRVIRLEPGSVWAKKAQARIDALQAAAKAEETRKAVFQEHGID